MVPIGKKSFMHFEATKIKENLTFYADKNKTKNYYLPKWEIGLL